MILSVFLSALLAAALAAPSMEVGTEGEATTIEYFTSGEPSTEVPSTSATNTPSPTTTGRKLGNVLEEAMKAGATDFVDLAAASNIGDILRGPGPFTLFVPSNEAFESIDSRELERIVRDPVRLHDFLGNHASSGSVYSRSITNEQLLTTLVSLRLRLNVYNLNVTNPEMVITANGAPVSTADIPASNGVVHIVDKVLYPAARLNIVETVAAAGGFKQLQYLLGLSTHIEELAKDGPFTFFAPTDKAIEKLKPEDIAIIIANQDILDEMLRAHTLKTTQFDPSLVDGARFISMTGEPVQVTVIETAEGALKLVNGSRIDPKTQAVASNGAFHGIDLIMLPEDSLRRRRHHI